MYGPTRIKHPCASATKVAALLCIMAAVGACTNTARFGGGEPETAAAPPATPPAATTAEPTPAEPPPVNLAGKWKLSAAGRACLMTFTDEPGTIDGKIAPAGGCPGNFFMSRKWTYEHGALTVRDFKGQALAELTFTGGQFEGKDADSVAITLARP